MHKHSYELEREARIKRLKFIRDIRNLALKVIVFGQSTVHIPIFLINTCKLRSTDKTLLKSKK